MLEEALKQVAIRLALVGRDWVVARLVQHETKVAVGPKAAQVELGQAQRQPGDALLVVEGMSLLGWAYSSDF